MIGQFGPDEQADWHTHSDRTDGADAASAMAAAAVQAGLSGWGLSDHVRRDTTWLPEYVAATRLIRYDGIDIRCGVEAKLLDRAGHLDLPTTLPRLDYILLADHQFPGQDGPQHPAAVRAALESGSVTAADVVSDLVVASVCGIRRSPFLPVLAHLFSLLPKMGLSEADVTQEHLSALASACLHAGGAVEVNEKWRCPSAHAIGYLTKAGVTITAGSDAHRTAEVGAHAYYDEVVAELGSAEKRRIAERRAVLIAQSA